MKIKWKLKKPDLQKLHFSEEKFYIVGSAVMGAALILCFILLLTRPDVQPEPEPEPAPSAVPTEALTPSPSPTAAPAETQTPTPAPSATPEVTDDPEEQAPSITPPAAYSVDVSSGSDIQLHPVQPATGSDLQPTPTPAPRPITDSDLRAAAESGSSGD